MEGYETPPVGGPGPIGQLAEIAVGAYTEIVGVIAPASAAYGDLVNVEVKIRNLADYGIYIATSGRYDGADIFPTEAYAGVEPGATHSFYFSFTMPNNDVRLHIESFFWTGTEWNQDDYSYVDIALAAIYRGAISRKELEYDESKGSIPVL